MKILARQLYDLFFESCLAYAIGGTKDNGEVIYTPTEGIPSLELIEQHIAGDVVLGAYTVLPGNRVRWMAFDIDCKSDLEKAKDIAIKLDALLEKIPHSVELSGGKGLHCILFFNETISAKRAKEAGEKVRDVLGLAKNGDLHVEVFPKQAELTSAHPLGSLMRLPTGIHPGTKRQTRFVDPKNDWAEISSVEALAFRADIEDLEKLVADPDATDQIVALLSPYWVEGQRHQMALCVAGYLATVGWTEDAVKDLVNLLYDENSGDLENQLEAVTDTFEKFYAGQKIVGFQGLMDILPGTAMRKLVNLASGQVSPNTLQLVDRIRLGEGAAFLKVRNAVATITSYFKESGRLVRNEETTYWLNYSTRGVMTINGPEWERFMHNEFGLNPLESFGKQVTQGVVFSTYKEATEVQVYKRCYWSGRELFINLGGPEVYVLDGTKIQVILNGERDILFLNNNDRMKLPNLLEDVTAPLDPWEFLVDDLNFLTGGNVHATPIQQRELLKAWVTAFFFAQTLPTRPILTLLAPQGAGKTTTARRILRFLEGLSEDVLGVNADKPDSLRSSLEAHKVLVLDNLEKTKTNFLTDILNRASTGSHIELRVLHTTNDVRRIKLDVFIIITATTMPFSEETVFSRILPIELAPLSSPRPEYQIQVQLQENYVGLWKGLLNDLNKVVAELKKNTTVEAPNESRLADFTVFCSRIKECAFINGKELMAGLASLVSRQKQALSESSPLIPVLEMLLRTRAEEMTVLMSMSDLFILSQRLANSQHMEWRWDTPQGLSRHVAMLEQDLIRYYGMSVITVRESGRDVKKYKFEKKMLKSM